MRRVCQLETDDTGWQSIGEQHGGVGQTLYLWFCEKGDARLWKSEVESFHLINTAEAACKPFPHTVFFQSTVDINLCSICRLISFMVEFSNSALCDIVNARLFIQYLHGTSQHVGIKLFSSPQKVWPENKTAFPNFFSKAAQDWWVEEIRIFYEEKNVKFDGLWIVSVGSDILLPSVVQCGGITSFENHLDHHVLQPDIH